LKKLENNMNIIGLGKTACDVAEQLKKYKQFKVYMVDHDIDGQNSFSFPNHKTAEDYENKFVNIPFEIEKELTLILSTDELISLSCLRILEQYKSLELKVMYIRPDIKFLNPMLTAVNKVVYNVLQELTRSGKIKSMFLVDTKKVSDIIGKVALKDRQVKIYDAIAYAYYMQNMFDNIQPILDNVVDSPPTYCIKTLGIMDLESGVENLFYPLDELREKRYNYYINKEELDSDLELSEHIEEQIDGKFQENLKISYAIYESSLEQSSVFIEAKTPHIQG